MPKYMHFTLAIIAGMVAATGPTFSMAEPAAAGSVFERLDTDDDGRITRKEMSAARAERLNALDADANGFITAAELEAHVGERVHARVERMIEPRDVDGDGQLSLDEMEHSRRAEARFDRADRDGDGVISQAELEAARADRKAFGHRRD